MLIFTSAVGLPARSYRYSLIEAAEVTINNTKIRCGNSDKFRLETGFDNTCCGLARLLVSIA